MKKAPFLKTATLNAFISVYDTEKTPDLIKFVKFLISTGWTIYSSGGTHKFLQDADLEVTEVEAITQMPAMLRNRVKTLHPAVLSGMIASSDLLPELADRGYIEFSLVYVTFYPLEEEMEREGATFESCIEKTDVGGPTMVQAACKSCRVIVIVEPSQLLKVQRWLSEDAPNHREFIFELGSQAALACADYGRLVSEVRLNFSLSSEEDDEE